MSFSAPLPSPTAAVRAKERGFTTILVLILIFLLMIMVITYLRTMRSYNGVHPPRLTGNALPVAQQVVTDLAAIIGADGNLNIGYAEPHDYPWTCSRRNAAYRLTYPDAVSGVGAMGDPKVDDSWLSPIEPEGGSWAQVSNPIGAFLVYDSADFAGVAPNFYTRDRVPMDAPAGLSIPQVAIGGSGLPMSVNFQNVPVGDPRLVDTDGDGVGDALWYYPKNAWSNGVRYVAAVKVVDLSGMLNLNTALGELASAPGSTTGTPRCGEGPYEIDASRVVGAMPAASKTLRQSGVATVPSGRAAAAWTDWDYWQASGGRTQDNGTSAAPGANRYSLVDEVQLRDYFNQYTPSPAAFPTVRAHYPALGTDLVKRRYVTTLGGVNDVYAPLPNSPAWDVTNIWDGSGASSFYYQRRPFDTYANQNTYANPAAPTTQQGGGSQWSGFSSGGWWDQCNFYESGWYGAVNFLRGINTNGYDATTVAQVPYPYPAGYTFLMNGYATLANEDQRALQYQIQMGANNMQDMLGRDNLTTVASQWMGWKPVPVMTEFYAQMPYVVYAPYQSLWPLNATGTFPNANVLVFPQTTIAQLAQKDIGNLNVKLGGAIAKLFSYTQSGSSITVQFQAYDPSWGPNTRCFKVQFTDSGAGVVAQALYAKYVAGNQEGINFDSTGSTGIYQSDFQIGLPPAAGTIGSTAPNRTQGYVNNVINRTAIGGVGASGGEVVYGGNNLTSTDWRASGSAGIGSYALELCNPYAIPIRMANVRFNFRRQDWHIWDTFKAAATPSYASLDLGAYVRALPPAGMAQDAEGFYVLKPGEKIVFYRNGLDLAGPGGVRRKPFGGAPDISSLITPGVYTVDLGATVGLGTPAITATQVPDINGYPTTWNVSTVELQVFTKFSGGNSTAGNTQYQWMDHQRLTFQSLGSGYDGNNCYKIESNVPDGRQAAPGDLVYKQIDARAFGVDTGLDALQFRPPVYRVNNQMPVDMGDEEFRTNTYAQVGSGLLPNGAKRLYPDGSQNVGGWNYGCNNTVSTMPLGSPNGEYLVYDGSNGTGRISALGLSTKVSFPTPSGVTLNTMYGGTRQSIKAEPTPPWNYLGLPGETAYPGTFSDLNAAGGAQMALRDNVNAGGGQGGSRRDGLPRVLDMVKFPLIGPIYCDHWPGSFIVGNCNFRGNNNAGGGWTGTGIPDAVNPLTGHWSQNTFGDALNFYLVKDIAKMGLRGLSLRTDVPWFNWGGAATAYPALPFSAAKTYANNVEALYNGDIYVAQVGAAATTLPPPDPTPVTGNVGPGKAWGYSNRAYARASQFWQMSWAELLASRWQVDSPAYKGKTANNGNLHKPGRINLNTAPKAVLECLSLPTGASSSVVADAIIANRKAPAAGAAVAGGTRQGLVLVSEALGANGMKTYTADNALRSGAGTSKFYTADTTLNLDTTAWLPGQATCRSDIFCAYVVVQGYPEKDFTLGPVDAVRLITLFRRDGSGNPATILGSGSYNIVRRRATDGDPNDWYTP